MHWQKRTIPVRVSVPVDSIVLVPRPRWEAWLLHPVAIRFRATCDNRFSQQSPGSYLIAEQTGFACGGRMVQKTDPEWLAGIGCLFFLSSMGCMGLPCQTTVTVGDE
jgi:hypothetical protein